MPKKVKTKMPKRQKSVEAVVIPTADNAKWMALGFLAAVVIVAVAVLLLWHAR